MKQQIQKEDSSIRLWTRSLLVYCVALLLILFAFLAMEYRLDRTAVELEPFSPYAENGEKILIKVNSASLDELQLLPRVGPVLAQAIIDYRTKHGAFRSFEQLLDVPGIGEKTLAVLKPLISLES